AGPEPCGDVFMKNTRRSGSGKGTGLSRTVLTTEKIAVFTPMPNASAEIAAREKLGFRKRVRRACLMSAIRMSTVPLDGETRKTAHGDNLAGATGVDMATVGHAQPLNTQAAVARPPRSFSSEDWLAVVIGFVSMAGVLAGVRPDLPVGGWTAAADLSSKLVTSANLVNGLLLVVLLAV